MESIEVQAAGAVVWRKNDDDLVEILLVHRPRYGDWSLPKGKVEGRESLIACAYREVLEETGLEVRFGQHLGNITYQVSEGLKSVDYWSAKYIEVRGERDRAEIDEIAWVKFESLSQYSLSATDVEIIARFQVIDLDAKTLIMLRHAEAIPRSEWFGEDTDRPLATQGEFQAKRLIANLVPFMIEEIHTSSAVRCYETITPFARALNANYIFTDALSEDDFNKDPERSKKYFQKLLVNDHPTLICSHNPVLPNLLEKVAIKSGAEISVTKLKPSDSWIVHHVDKEVVAVDFMPAPTI